MRRAPAGRATHMSRSSILSTGPVARGSGFLTSRGRGATELQLSRNTRPALPFFKRFARRSPHMVSWFGSEVDADAEEVAFLSAKPLEWRRTKSYRELRAAEAACGDAPVVAPDPSALLSAASDGADPKEERA